MNYLVILALVAHTGFASFIPPTIFGDPVSMSVVAEDPPDFRGKPVYRIDFSVKTKGGLQNGMVHRNWDEFQEFQSLINSELTLNPGITLPSEPSVELLNDYLIEASENPNLMISDIMSHFLGINWDGKDLKFFVSFVNFIEIVSQVIKAPYFQPEPPIFDNEDDAILLDEAPYE
ncbi:unnamed protein product, partial [Meganyctiphanes norvegica]